VSIIIIIPGQCEPKGRARVGKTRNKHTGQIVSTHYTPLKTKSYEHIVQRFATLAMAGRQPLNKAIRCEVHIDQPTPESWSNRKKNAALDGQIWPSSRPDIDNYIKSIFDGCNGIVWVDDAQVVELHAHLSYAHPPQVCLEVWEK